MQLSGILRYSQPWVRRAVWPGSRTHDCPWIRKQKEEQHGQVKGEVRGKIGFRLTW
jgi:hypothetical protein